MMPNILFCYIQNKIGLSKSVCSLFRIKKKVNYLLCTTRQVKRQAHKNMQGKHSTHAEIMIIHTLEYIKKD